MNEIDIAIGVLCLIVTFFPGVLLGGTIGWLLPMQWTGVATCIAVVALTAEVAGYFVNPHNDWGMGPFVFIAVPLAFTTLLAYFLVSWANASVRGTVKE